MDLKLILKSRFHLFLLVGIGVLYVWFLSLDVFALPRSLPSRYLKYASVVFCFLLAGSFHFSSANKKDSKYVVIALFFTLIADVFLLFTTQRLTGVLVFCFVQLVYLKRYDNRFFLTGLGLVSVSNLVYIFSGFSALHVAAGLYAVLIVLCFSATFFGVAARAFSAFRLRCVRSAMVLFILCDVHVALYNYIGSTSPYYRVVTVAMWLFYLPSQLLLALSAWHPKKKTVTV